MKKQIKQILVSFVAAVSVLAASSVASGQDFSKLKGDNQGKGRNALPNLNGPGRGILQWFRPNINDNIAGTAVIDNLAGPPDAVAAGAWVGPTVDQEAAFPFLPDPNAAPAYVYTSTVASDDQGDDPTLPLAGGPAAQTFTWTLNGLGAIQRDYAIYVWQPLGPTLDNLNQPQFPQRFYVYEILYSNGLRWVEIVDTSLSGGGWIRLGGRGGSTNQLFQYNGTNPIVVRLYNTVPRTSGGTLTGNPGTSIVYADAVMAVPEIGYFSASPIVGQHAVNPFGANTSAIGARNERSVVIRNGQAETIENGVVTAWSWQAGGTTVPHWTFNPSLEDPALALNQDNNSVGVTAAPAWTPPDTTGANFRGTDYLTAAPVAAGGSAVTYDPNTALSDGSYDIYAWLPGDSVTRQFATAITYEIHEGLTVTNVTVDQSLARGWVRLGNRRFNHTTANRLRVLVTDVTSDIATDATREAYADTIRFVGVNNLAIHSTPVMVNARVNTGTGVVDKDVVIVAAENGRLYCVDAVGRGDGSTDVYWTYPTTPDPTTPTPDPNEAVGEDGPGIIAQMPTSGFDISSAMVQRIGAEDFLYIAARNGRVYCIAMDGRGDGDLTLRKPGTTRRVWSFPNDYPAAAQTSNLGPFVGSLVFENTAAGPTIFVPTTQGRMYALDAVGNVANKTTNIRWQFPGAAQPTLGAIETTPTVEFNRIYFGTDAKDTDQEPRGAFYCLDMNTGAQVWRFDGAPATGSPVPCDDFLGGPITVPAALLGAGMNDTVFASNENRFIYALDATTGAIQWQTDEISTGVRGPLTFTPMIVLGNDTVTFGVSPVLLVPAADGRVVGLFAGVAVNRVGTKRAYQFSTAGDFLQTGVAVGRGWMYITDNKGYIYALNDDASGLDPGQGAPPTGVGVDLSDNDASADAYRNAKIAFITQTTYRGLRKSDGPPPLAPDPTLPTRAQALAGIIPPTARNAFEWGETLYVMVYDFPYQTTGVSGLVAPPQVNFSISVEGTAIRNITQPAKLFRSSTPDTPDSGYAILAFPLQGGGANSIPPGSGRFSFTISTAALSASGTVQQIPMAPTADKRRDFVVANPLAVTVFDLTGGSQSLARTSDPDNAQAQSQGSPDDPSTGVREDLLTSPLGFLSHGQSGKSRVSILDRSMMTLLRGPGRGLDNVRVQRRDMEWQGGAAAVIKPIDQLAFPLFEELPVNFPNYSPEYPNVPREHVLVTKDPDSSPENPLYGPVSLVPPDNVDANDPTTRVLVDTPFEFDMRVPKYQPANLTQIVNSIGTPVPAGYYGRVQVFVDSSGNGVLDRSNNRREAYRAFWLAGGVTRDERIVITTPTLDFGSLGPATGYTPAQPGTAGSTFSPWPNNPLVNPYLPLFREFQMLNEGNVNMNNVRLAKATNVNGTISPWPVPAAANHEMSWMDAEWHVWSDFDYTSGFSLTTTILLQKPRVGDRVGTSFSPNPQRRENPNTGALAGPLMAGVPSGPGRIGITAPIGLPVGTYMQILRVIEDGVDANTGFIISTEADAALRLTPTGEALEPYSDPTVSIIFKIREGRLTNTFTPRTFPMIDNNVPVATNPAFLHKNAQPAAYRDLGGNIALAYTSNQDSFNQALPTAASTNDRWRIYLASLDGGGYSLADRSPLQSLNQFAKPPGAPRFWTQRPPAYPVPAVPSQAQLTPLFLPAAGETVLEETVKFGGASFPAGGVMHPFSPGTTMGPIYMAFVGEAQKQSQAGRVFVSHIFMSTVSMAADGSLTVSDPPSVLSVDSAVGKSKPAILQVGSNATVFYATSGTGQAQIFWNHFNGAAWGNTNVIPLGGGFESATSPQVFGRPVGAAGDPGIEMTFVGKLRSRPFSEVFYCRFPSSASGIPANAPVYFPAITDSLTSEGGGLYQAQGVSWNPQAPPVLEQKINGGLPQNLEMAGTRVRDPQTGIVSFDSRLGGKVYLDPAMGTVRFSSASPSPNAELLLTYSARYLRVSSGKGASHSAPTVLVDNRRVGGIDYWARPNNTGATATDQIRPTRFIFTYGRGASGQGLTSRPYIKTLRLGVQLDGPIYTNPDGTLPAGFSVTGATSFYQVDPANGKIYFTDVDEGRTVTVQYTRIDEATGNPYPAPSNKTADVGLLVERAEAPVPIEQAVNETQLTSTLDPFQPADASHTTPGLIWMFWSSTRAGAPDLFFQTIAPRFTPTAKR